MAGDGRGTLGAEQLAILAHEVRSPVAALVALSDASATADAPTSQQLLLLARVAAEDVIRLCEELGGVARPPARRVPIEQVLAAATAPGVSIAGGEGLAVAGDATGLRQALRNVVANAVRHASSVDVVAFAEGDRVVIEISDDGPGVDADADVFEKGVSGVGSTGYGLWLARSIVEEHGGTLELVRMEAPGARFRIVLPLAPASA